MKAIIVGTPGKGKTTLARMLKQDYPNAIVVSLCKLRGASYLVDGKACVMTGQHCHGTLLFFKHDIVDDEGNAIAKKAKDCKLLKKNAGLVFIS